MKSSHYLLLFILLMLLAGLMSCSSDCRPYRIKQYEFSHRTMTYATIGTLTIESYSKGYHTGDTIEMNTDYLKVIVDTVK